MRQVKLDTVKFIRLPFCLAVDRLMSSECSVLPRTISKPDLYPHSAVIQDAFKCRKFSLPVTLKLNKQNNCVAMVNLTFLRLDLPLVRAPAYSRALAQLNDTASISVSYNFVLTA